MTQPAAAPSQSRSLHEDVAVAHDGEAIPMVRVGEKQSGNEFLRLSKWLGYCSCGLAGRLATAAWKGCEVVCGRDGQRLVGGGAAWEMAGLAQTGSAGVARRGGGGGWSCGYG